MFEEVTRAAKRLGNVDEGISLQATAVVLNHLYVHKAPQSSFTNNGLMERKCGVYGLFEGDELVYIGASRDLYGRIKTHFRGSADQRYIKPFDAAAFVETENDALTLVEDRLIRTLKPRGNRKAAIPGKHRTRIRLDELSEILCVPYEELKRLVDARDIDRQHLTYDLYDCLVAYGQSKNFSPKC